MAGEMVKKQKRARCYLSCNYFCSLYFLVKIALVKNLHASANLAQQNRNQKRKGCKDGEIYQNL